MSQAFVPPTSATTLFIAEKNKQIPAILTVLPKPHKFCNGFVITPAGVVTSLIGHILKQLEPEEYDETYKKWNLDNLPFLSPKEWKNKPVSDKVDRLKLIKNLLEKSTDVIHAADPGREGQLIVDEVLKFLKNKLPVRRIQFPELNQKSVLKAFQDIRPNTDFQNLLAAAECRQHADFLLGINLTRLFSKRAQALGYKSVVSLGRVQTPTLKLIVDRENEIRNFIPVEYFKINGFWEHSSKTFKSLWVPRKDQKGLDSEGRLVDSKVADDIVAVVKKENKGVVSKFETVRASEDHPLPHEIGSMYGAMDSQMKADTSATLEALQSLYDQGYMSYPRTDNPYYSTSKHPEAPSVIANLTKISDPDIASWAKKANPTIFSRAWNDNPKPGKVIEHTGLSPTESVPDFDSLSSLEKAVYKEATKRYLCQFYPLCDVDKTTVLVESANYDFVTRGRVIINPGWRVVINNLDDDEKPEGDDSDNESGTLPVMKVGDVVPLKKIDTSKEVTRPPSRYNVKTLIDAMKNIHKTVTDPNSKKMLKNVEGIGTAATTGQTLETLFARNFMIKEKSHLKPTEMGEWVIKSAPDRAKSPILTAKWESALESVAMGTITADVFEAQLDQWIEKLVSDCKVSALDPIPEKALKESQAAFEKKFGKSSGFATKGASSSGKGGKKGSSGKGGKSGSSSSGGSPATSGTGNAFSRFGNQQIGASGNRGFGGVKKDIK
jgi:DNA topoisomerase III